MLKKFLRQLLANRGYKILQCSAHRHHSDWTFFEGVLLGYMCGGTDTRVVQVGANDGATNDPLRRPIAMSSSKPTLVLVEPQEHLLSTLREVYKSVPSVYIAQFAIGYSGTKTLFQVNPNLLQGRRRANLTNPSAITSASRDHVIRGVAKLSGMSEADAAQTVTAVEVECVTLEQLLRRLGLRRRVDVLSIDVEGFDDEVIYTSDLETLRPSIVNYEVKHLPEHRLESLRNFLDHLGYIRFRWSHSDEVAIRSVDTYRQP